MNGATRHGVEHSSSESAMNTAQRVDVSGISLNCEFNNSFGDSEIRIGIVSAIEGCGNAPSSWLIEDQALSFYLDSLHTSCDA